MTPGTMEIIVNSGLVARRVFSVPFIFLLLFGMASFNFPALIVAQSALPTEVQHDTPGRVIKQGQSVHVDVELALVNVTVTDPHNRMVTGLESDNFRIFENDVEQEIQYFSSEDVPISIGVVFDLSGSMANKIGKSKEAALQFFKTANPQDEFLLVSFNERAELTSSFTNSVEDLQSSLLSSSAKGRTALLDAIYLSLSEMRARETPNGLCSAYPTGAITIVGIERTTSSAWRERQIPSCTPLEYLTHWSTAAEP